MTDTPAPLDVRVYPHGLIKSLKEERDAYRQALEVLANPDGIIRAGDPSATRIPSHEFAQTVLRRLAKESAT